MLKIKLTTDRQESKYTYNKSKNLHSTVAVIIGHDYHKGKFETEAQILGMRPNVVTPKS